MPPSRRLSGHSWRRSPGIGLHNRHRLRHDTRSPGWEGEKRFTAPGWSLPTTAHDRLASWPSKAGAVETMTLDEFRGLGRKAGKGRGSRGLPIAPPQTLIITTEMSAAGARVLCSASLAEVCFPEGLAIAVYLEMETIRQQQLRSASQQRSAA